MKQHITLSQLNELSEKGKEKLRKWWKPEEGDMCVTNTGYEVFIGEHVDYERFQAFMADLPLLSIGQMIEFLEVHGNDCYTVFDIWWHMKMELCDALWEAVKEVLEK